MKNIQLKIKRFDKSLPMPAYKTKGAAGMDLSAREDTEIKSHSIGYIPLNVAMEIPEGHWVLLAARSSTHKMGLIPANGIGVGDWDFRGDNDEYKLIVFNYTKEKVIVKKGTRVAQMIVTKFDRVEIQEVEQLQNPDRGGIGSTGQ